VRVPHRALHHRPVFEHEHAVEALGEIYQRRNELRGLRIVSAPAALRHFSARLEELPASA